MIIDSIKTKMTENQKELTENLAGKKANANLSAKKEAQKALGNAKMLLVAENEPKKTEDKTLTEKVSEAKTPFDIGKALLEEAGEKLGEMEAERTQKAANPPPKK